MKYLKTFNEKMSSINESIAEDYLKELHHKGAISSDVYDITREEEDLSTFKGTDSEIKKELLKHLKYVGGISSDAYQMELEGLLESREEREGTFDYFMTKSKEELLDYQKNFQHNFENPAEHDPKYVAWKKACEIKGCFKVPTLNILRKRRELEGKSESEWKEEGTDIPRKMIY